jgi:hypothetical protein
MPRCGRVPAFPCRSADARRPRRDERSEAELDGQHAAVQQIQRDLSQSMGRPLTSAYPVRLGGFRLCHAGSPTRGASLVLGRHAGAEHRSPDLCGVPWRGCQVSAFVIETVAGRFHWMRVSSRSRIRPTPTRRRPIDRGTRSAPGHRLVGRFRILGLPAEFWPRSLRRLALSIHRATGSGRRHRRAVGRRPGVPSPHR